MLESHPRAGIRNRLLQKISPEDWTLLAPSLEPVTMRERQVVEVPHKPITHAYFMDTGVVSVVAVDKEDHRIEVGVIGFEGVTGVPLIMGDTRGHSIRPICRSPERAAAFRRRYFAKPSAKASRCAC